MCVKGNKVHSKLSSCWKGEGKNLSSCRGVVNSVRTLRDRQLDSVSGRNPPTVCWWCQARKDLRARRWENCCVSPLFPSSPVLLRSPFLFCLVVFLFRPALAFICTIPPCSFSSYRPSPLQPSLFRFSLPTALILPDTVPSHTI